MKIKIIVADQIVLCDDAIVHLPNLDWGHVCFTGDPGTVLDDVWAVQFDTETGQGWIEYKMLQTRQAMRPNVKPPDCPITQKEFDDLFGWVMPEYAKGLAAQQERLAREAEASRIEAERAALESQASRTSADLAAAQDSGTAQEIEALKAQNKELSDKLAGLDDALKAIYEAQVRVAKGDE